MASNNETATARIFMDGKQAGVELKKLEDQTSDLRREIIRLNKEGKSKEAEARKKDLKVLQRETRKLKLETSDVTHVMKNLNKVNFNQLEAAQKKLIKAQRSLNQGSIAYEQNLSDLSKVTAQLKKVKAEMYSQMTPAQRVAQTIKGWLPAFGFVAILSGLKSVAGELLNLTKEMQGDAVRSTTVLGDSYGYVAKQAETMAEKMGLTERKFISNTAAAADLLVPLGFQRDVAAKMAVKLQSLVGPLDEWTGGQIGATEVSNILTKALLGENEQLKQLGVAIKMDSKEFTDLVKLYQKREGVTKAQAQAMAELELITKKSADAQTAYNGSGNKSLRMEKQLTVWWQRKKEAVVAYFDIDERSKTEDQIKRTNLLTIEMTSANTTAERRNEIYAELQRVAPDVVKNIDKENISVSTLRENLEQYNQVMIKKLALQDSEAALEKERETAGEKTAERVEKEMELRTELLSIQNQAKRLNPDLVKQIEEINLGNDDVIVKSEKIVALLGKQRDFYRTTADGLSGGIIEARKDEKEATDDVTKAMEAYSDRYEAIFGKGSTDEDEGSTITRHVSKVKITEFKDDGSDEKEFEKQMDLEIKLYLEAQQKLAAIRKEYGLEKDGEQYNEALRQLEDYHEKELLSEDEYQLAKKAIKDAYKEVTTIEDLEADILAAETDEEKWQAQFDLAQERYDQEFNAANGNRLKELKAKKKYEADVQKIENERLNAKVAIKNAETELAMNGLNTLRTIVGEETALGKLLFVTEQAMAVGRIWFHTGIANAKAVAAMPLTAGQPWVGINTASAVLQTAKIAAQTVKGFSGGGDTGDYDRNDAAGIVHGQEYVIPAYLYKDDPIVSALVANVIEPKRTGIQGINYSAANQNIDKINGYAEGGDVEESDNTFFQDDSSLIETLQQLNSILSKGIKGKFVWQDFTDMQDEVETIKNNANY